MEGRKANGKPIEVDSVLTVEAEQQKVTGADVLNDIQLTTTYAIALKFLPKQKTGLKERGNSKTRKTETATVPCQDLYTISLQIRQSGKGKIFP